MLDKDNSGIFLALALFPLTGVLGLHTLFLNNIGPKIFHFVSRIVLIILTIFAFCYSGSCGLTLGVGVIGLPVIYCAIGLYIYTIIEAIVLFIKARTEK